MSDIRALYQEIILDHNKNPRNFRVMDDADHLLEGYNPLCGDHYTIYLKLDGEVIKDISFSGAGCAISKASASVMSSMVKGKTKAEVLAMFEIFHGLVMGEGSKGKSLDDLGRLAVFGGVSEYPARVKCASLAWHTMRGALESKTQAVTTE